MKISLIHPTMYGQGGAERVVYAFAEKLKERGHLVEIVSVKFDDAWKRRVEDSGIVFKEVGYNFGKAGYFLSLGFLSKKLSRLIDKDAEVLCPHNFPAVLAVKEYKEKVRAGTPAVWYCEEPFAFYYDQEYLQAVFPHYRIVFYLSRWLYSQHDKTAAKNFIDLVLANSKYTLRRVKEVYGVCGKVLHPATDPQKFQPNLRVPGHIRKVKENVDWFLFAPVGRFSFSKNVIRLVFVGNTLVDSGYRVRMIITGEGYLKDTLRKIIDKLRLNEYITLGFVSEADLPYYYAMADVVVYPTLNEPFGLAVVEAMASGTPPVVANIGGPSETVIDGVTGVHVNPYSVSSIFKGTITLLDDKDLREKMGEQGRKHVLANYTWERAVDEYERHLLTLAQRK